VKLETKNLGIIKLCC